MISKQEISDADLLKLAIEATAKSQQTAQTNAAWKQSYMGYVGCALISEAGNIYTGVVLNFQNGIGFCAEHSAVAEMVKNGESRIVKIAGATAKGAALPPCGRCREMMIQLDPKNCDTEVLLPNGQSSNLKELIPNNWQNYWDG